MVPTHCDYCARTLNNCGLAWDAKSTCGGWGWMCPSCFNDLGVGEGIGRGQRYMLLTPGGKDWKRVTAAA